MNWDYSLPSTPIYGVTSIHIFLNYHIAFPSNNIFPMLAKWYIEYERDPRIFHNAIYESTMVSILRWIGIFEIRNLLYPYIYLYFFISEDFRAEISIEPFDENNRQISKIQEIKGLPKPIWGLSRILKCLNFSIREFKPHRTWPELILVFSRD